MRLFSYCIPTDDGAAPNPYFEICTLTICKPVIRRNAEVGDWIAGVGSKNVNGADYSGRLVYAMKVTDVMSLEQYDSFCRDELQGKIPDIHSKNYQKRVGDCIYDFEASADGKLRPSVHGLGNRKTDLGGKNALLSTHFYYFGDQSIEIPQELTGIIKQGQGHKSTSNEGVKLQFVEWIENAGYRINSLNGKPQVQVIFKQSQESDSVESSTCYKRCAESEEDENQDIE